MKRLAVCVGLTRVDANSYGGWDGDCPGSDKDAARFASLCHDVGYDGVTCLINQAASKANIKSTFQSMAKVLVAGDLLTLYNSGHGGQQADVDGDEADRQDETLCWWDGQIIDDQLAFYLSQLSKGVRVFFVTDTCNSGTNYRGVSSRPFSTPVKLKDREMPSFRGRLLHFGGCADGKSSFGSAKGGAFTNALCLALSKKPKTYAEWFAGTRKLMPKNQIPVMAQWGMSYINREPLK